MNNVNTQEKKYLVVTVCLRAYSSCSDQTAQFGSVMCIRMIMSIDFLCKCAHHDQINHAEYCLGMRSLHIPRGRVDQDAAQVV